MPRRSFDEEELREAIAASFSYSDALRRLRLRTAGGNHRTLQKYVRLWGISVDVIDDQRHCRASRDH